MEEEMEITGDRSFTPTDDSGLGDVSQNNTGIRIRKDIIGSRNCSTSSDEDDTPESTSLNEDCLDELENLLVPETVLCTGSTPTRKISRQTAKMTRIQSSGGITAKEIPGKNPTKASVKELPGGARDDLGHSNEENGQDDDDDEDNEFEDEVEMEVVSFGIGIEEEQRLRQPVILPKTVMKRSSLSLKDKVDIIKELQNGERQSWLCNRRLLPKSTVQSIWQNRFKILEASEKNDGRKRCRRAQYEGIEDKLVEWVESLKSQNVPVNGPQLRAKAQVFAKQLGVSEFRSSTGWLVKFKTRHNLDFKKSPKLENYPNSSAADKKLAIDWVTKIWPNLCEGYTPDNIFNADEFGIFYKALPDLTNGLMKETCDGGTMAHERLTVLICSNSDGSEKRPLTVVGNGNIVAPINMKNLPVHYMADPKSWMTQSIFVQELRRWNQKLRRTNRNVLLIVDNSPAHVTGEQFSNIKLVLLPPVVSSILQPLEHGIIELVKLQYRRLLIDKVLRKCGMGDPDHVSKAVDPFMSIMEAMIMLDCAWSSVSPETILECFKVSNLQSINVNMGASTSTAAIKHPNNKSESDAKLDSQLIERLTNFKPYLHMPSNMSLGLFNQIDAKLYVTDYINDEQSYKPGEGQLENVTVATLNAPSKFQVQDYLTSIRNWVLSLPSDLEERCVHESLSVLENFCLRQANDVLRPSHSQQIQLSASSTTASSLAASTLHQQTSRNNHSSSTNRMSFSGPLSNNVNITQQSSSSMLNLPSLYNSNANTQSHSSAPSAVTFTLAESIPPSGIPHHFMDHQLYSYL